MGACFDRLRCEVFQNLFLSPMNTGFVRPAVATVLTVYGIETIMFEQTVVLRGKLQQYLPFTVLKLKSTGLSNPIKAVATVLTVYGIETEPNSRSHIHTLFLLQQYLPFTVLKQIHSLKSLTLILSQLQQYLPFTVLKHGFSAVAQLVDVELQQYLPFTVLKQ